MIVMTVIGICTILLSIIAGIEIGIFTWGSDKSSPYLTDYMLEQPFGNYWTFFIVIGITIPVAILMLKKRMKKTQTEIIYEFVYYINQNENH